MPRRLPRLSDRLIERLDRDGLFVGRKKPMRFQRLRSGRALYDVGNWKWEILDADGGEVLGSCSSARECLAAKKLCREIVHGSLEVYPCATEAREREG